MNPAKWEEEFNKKFVDNKREDGEDFTLYRRDDAIKAFIREALSAQQASLRERLEELKLKEAHPPIPEIKGDSYRMGSNAAIDAAIALLDV